MVHWKDSYKYGKEKEIEILPKLSAYFEREIIANQERYSKFDFTDDKFNYELKSRTNRLSAYPTTMITKNKIEDNDKPTLLIFNYTDCLAFIEYNEEQFKNYHVEEFSRARQDWDKKPHIYIPVNHLTVIESYC